MFRVVSKENPETSNRMFHMIQNSTTNKEIFDRNAVFRDNGVISIGTVLIIVNPDPIENYMNGIPAITTKERVIVAKPMNHPNIPLSNNLEGNDSKAFVYNEAKISLERVTFVDSKCSGNFCDRQRVSEVQHRSKCGCFSIKSNASCIIPIFIIKYTPKNGNCKVIQEFSSLKFFSSLQKEIFLLSTELLSYTVGMTDTITLLILSTILLILSIVMEVGQLMDGEREV